MPPYRSSAAGPPVTTRVLPPTAPPALAAKRMVTVTRGWTTTSPSAPTPAGRVAGPASGSPVRARAAAIEATGPAVPAEAQLSSPKGSCSWPDAGSPSVTAGSPIRVIADTAWKSSRPTLTGATWVGA